MLDYRIEGSGPPLLLIHGWGVTYTIWQNLIPLLAPHYQLIMIELPGIGNSPMTDSNKPYYLACTEAIEEVRVALEIQQWSLLAYSTGTRVAEAYIQQSTATIERAIFLCPVYLRDIWVFFLHLLRVHNPQPLIRWILSDWRLYNLIRVLGFNWKRHAYTYVWKNEIERQPVRILVRSLRELPGKGHKPFTLPALPSLFIWGRRDALIKHPRHLHANDILIAANHSAPMLAAPMIADIVIPFLDAGQIISPSPLLRRRHQRTRQKRKRLTNALSRL